MTNRPSAAPATGKKTLWAWAAGTFFGVGLLKPGPGTWGSVAATLLWGVAASFTGHISFSMRTMLMTYVGPSVMPVISLALCAGATAFGIPAASIVARESGREDPGHVVIDEVAGQWLTLVVCRPDWQHALLALLLFRFFDITKPWPIRKLESLPGGWGIMLDDLAAGLLGAVVLFLIQLRW